MWSCVVVCGRVWSCGGVVEWSCDSVAVWQCGSVAV